MKVGDKVRILDNTYNQCHLEEILKHDSIAIVGSEGYIIEWRGEGGGKVARTPDANPLVTTHQNLWFLPHEVEKIDD